jgi:hypothetical protein
MLPSHAQTDDLLRTAFKKFQRPSRSAWRPFNRPDRTRTSALTPLELRMVATIDANSGATT